MVVWFILRPMQVGQKLLARFFDVCETQFSSLSANKDRISKFLADLVGGRMAESA